MWPAFGPPTRTPATFTRSRVSMAAVWPFASLPYWPPATTINRPIGTPSGLLEAAPERGRPVELVDAEDDVVAVLGVLPQHLGQQSPVEVLLRHRDGDPVQTRDGDAVVLVAGRRVDALRVRLDDVHQPDAVLGHRPHRDLGGSGDHRRTGRVQVHLLPEPVPDFGLGLAASHVHGHLVVPYLSGLSDVRHGVSFPFLQWVWAAGETPPPCGTHTTMLVVPGATTCQRLLVVLLAASLLPATGSGGNRRGQPEPGPLTLAPALGQVHGRVRRPQDDRVVVTLPGDDQTHAHRDRLHDLVEVPLVELVERVDSRELVAAEPGDDPPLAQPVLELGRRVADEAVALLVALRVVDLLEAVEVDHHDRARPLRQRLARLGLEPDTGVESGHRVTTRLVHLAAADDRRRCGCPGGSDDAGDEVDCEFHVRSPYGRGRNERFC